MNKIYSMIFEDLVKTSRSPLRMVRNEEDLYWEMALSLFHEVRSNNAKHRHTLMHCPSTGVSVPSFIRLLKQTLSLRIFTLLMRIHPEWKLTADSKETHFLQARKKDRPDEGYSLTNCIPNPIHYKIRIKWYPANSVGIVHLASMSHKNKASISLMNFIQLGTQS